MTRRTKKRIPKHIAARLEKCRKQMAKARLSAYLITNPVDQIYLTGFTGEDGAAVITADKVYLITDGRFDEQADREAPWAKKIVRSKGISDELTKLRKRLRWRRVGFQADCLTVTQSSTFRKALKPARLLRAKPIVNDLRLCKDDHELRATRRAIEVAQDAFRATCKAIRIGMTEHEVAARLEYEMRRRGASGAAFPSIVAEGPNAALPHAQPGNRRIRNGSLLLIDWGAAVGHYRSDLTRVVFVRRIPPRFRRMYAAVLEAQRRAIAAVRPGISTRAVDRAARSYLKSVGYGKAFTHGTGHGLGLNVHEAPSLSRRNPVPLRPGMVITIEPGVYRRGVGGIRIEDDVQVTQDGPRVLSSLSAGLNDMVIRG
jgi:Xaa-Pro aminopeptidase